MKFKKLISELIRRNVFKAVIAYLAVAWIIVQIASVLLPAFDAPSYSLKVIIYLLAIGLVLWVIFSWLYDLTSEGFKRTESIENTEEVTKLNSKRLNKVIAGSLFIAVLLLIGGSFWVGTKIDEGLFSENKKKVAVLPFTLNAEEADELDVLGITAELIEELSKVDELSVLHQNSSKLMTPELSTADILIATEVKNVDYFVDGTVDQEERTLSARIVLTEGLQSDTIWSKSYTDHITQARNFWAQIAKDLSREMGVELKPEDSKLLTNLKPIKPESYALYKKGKQRILKNSPQEWDAGIALLQQAIDEDPTDSYAWAYQAEGYITIGHGPHPSRDVFPKARAAAEEAIHLDSTNAIGWAALAHYHTYFGWDWDLAEYAFNKANELNPSLAYNHYHRAWYYTLFGRMNEAIEAHKLAQELDPFTPQHTAFLGDLYRMVGLYEEGLKEVEKTLEMNDQLGLAYIIKSLILVDQGKSEEGIEAAKKVSEYIPMFASLSLGMAYAQTGRKEEAKKIIKKLEEEPVTPFDAYVLGLIYANLGEIDKTLEWLKKEPKHAFYPWIRVQLFNKGLDNNPEYLELMREMNLPDPAPLVYNPD